MGPDTKANTRELVRAPGGLLERLQRRVALEALGESDSSFVTEAVLLQTASTGEEASSEECQGALTQKRTLGAGAHLSVEIIVSLRTAASAEAPSAPILF